MLAVTPEPGFDERELLALAAAVEHRSEHPVARSVTEAARARDLPLPEADDFASTPGRGVAATVAGRRVEVGAPARLLPTVEGAAGPDGASTVLVLVDGVPAGRIALANRLRPDAAGAVADLARLTGTPPVLLTRDGPGAAARVEAAAGIDDVRAGLLPHEKAEAVRDLARRSGRKVLLIGDGVNDAPALAAAHTGVAMGRAGSDLALETADAVVVRDELAAVPRTVALSRRARRLVTQNLVIAGVCIVLLTVWDLAGRLPLPLGVAGHEGSTILVALNGLRLLREKAW